MSTLARRPATILDGMEEGSFEPAPTAERALVERARVDPDAFAELYRLYLDRVHAFAWRRTGSREAAEDVTSATFESAYRSLDSFEWRKGGFAPWLFRIAANQTVGHHRREGRQQSDRGQVALARLHTPVASHDPQDLLGGDHRQLRAALDQLNPRYQRAIALRHLAGLEPDEAARAMGLSRPALAVVLSRALKALRRELDRLTEEVPAP
ncbi:MAG: sigma-70 family RNA polymerase sigma factor [Actinomycetia bacterium]|nr:sigma-70 family RNA polymerase sigma factor [Actinomycetes bacterium]